MPLQERDEAAVDPRLEKATEFAEKALNREPKEPTEVPEPREPKAPAETFDPRQVIDKITFPAHERAIASQREKKLERQLAAMEKRFSERLEALVPKPPKPQEPDFQTDPVGWQEWRDQQFREGIVEDIVQRIQPPQDPERARAEAAQRESMDEVGGWMRQYVETTYQEQGYPSPREAWDAMDQRARAYQEIRVHEIMQERGVDFQTATAWKNQEVAMAARWAAENGRQPIAYLDGLAMQKISQYAGSAPQKDEDAEERKKASSSAMAGGIGTTQASREGNGKPLTRMSLKDVPRDRKAYRELVAKNRQPGETLEAANRRVRTQLLKSR